MKKVVNRCLFDSFRVDEKLGKLSIQLRNNVRYSLTQNRLTHRELFIFIVLFVSYIRQSSLWWINGQKMTYQWFIMSFIFYLLIFLSPYFIHERIVRHCVLTLQRFFSTERTEKNVHCSELGVHLAEVYLQQKSIGGTETSVQTGVVH
jgi:hypothetical protein